MLHLINGWKKLAKKKGNWRRTVARDSKTCVIKGYLCIPGNGNKNYHFPGCGQYNQTLVELYKGDQWFCTEAQAKATGFAKGLAS